ncbi:MAG: hypothetical protein CL912_12820 [Deltaproteobacteria bacterium]|nr:hypothetical protein [Deltaproteobacteria bacterium]
MGQKITEGKAETCAKTASRSRCRSTKPKMGTEHFEQIHRSNLSLVRKEPLVCYKLTDTQYSIYLSSCPA